jgi:hypothetical protein
MREERRREGEGGEGEEERTAFRLTPSNRGGIY